MCPRWGYDGALILSFSASFSHFSPPLTVLLRIIFLTHSHSHLRPCFGEHPKTKNPLTLHHFLHQQSECVLCVLIPQMLFRPIENVLYGIILVLIYSVMLNKTLLMGTSKTEVKIVSQQAPAISEAILQQVDRGVTFLHGEGGYLHQPTEVILSVLSNRELPKVSQIVRNIDPEAFLIITEVKEVHGRGFSIKKYHK